MKVLELFDEIESPAGDEDTPIHPSFEVRAQTDDNKQFTVLSAQWDFENDYLVLEIRRDW